MPRHVAYPLICIAIVASALLTASSGKRGRPHSPRRAAHRHAGLGARRHQDPRPRSQSRSCDRDDRTGVDRSRQDRAQGRLGRRDAVGLAVGRARALARRCPGVLSVVEHARRRDGAGTIADQVDSPISRDASSRSRAARWTRAGCCCRGWRGAPGIDLRKQATIVYGAPPLLVREGAAGRDRRHADVLEFLRRPRKQGLTARAVDMADVMKGLGAKGPVAIVGYTFDSAFAARKRSAVDRFLEAARQAKAHSRIVGRRMAAARAAHRHARREGAGDLPPALQ